MRCDGRKERGTKCEDCFSKSIRHSPSGALLTSSLPSSLTANLNLKARLRGEKTGNEKHETGDTRPQRPTASKVQI